MMPFIHPHARSVTTPAVAPKRIIEALGRLQKYAINTIPSTIYIYDLIDQCNLCSSCSLATMLGYTPEEINAMGVMGFAELIHPEDLEQVSEHFQQFTILLEGEVIEIEYRVKRADGTWCWLRSQETLFVQAVDGLPLQILGIVQDITAHKQALESQSVFAYAMEHLSETVMITDRDGTITYVNRAFEQVTGYRRIEVLGRTPAILKSGQHDFTFYRQLWSTLQAGEAFQAEFINRKRNGHFFCEEKTITPMKNNQGQITHYLSLGKVLVEYESETELPEHVLRPVLNAKPFPVREIA